MAALPRWFTRKPESVSRAQLPRNWQKELEALEEEAERASRAFRGTPLNKAGDLCLRAGDRARALDYYGRAIDVLLEDSQREAARGVANKIIRVHPQAVRTLCTLTWLDLASRHMATALLHLRDYVEAAKRAGQEAITGDQIYQMARVTPQDEFLGAVADSLDQLGFADRASEVRQWAGGEGSPDVLTDPDGLAEHCLLAAVGVNMRKSR
jgi:tetratricopeptide (TPR) repeat protein